MLIAHNEMGHDEEEVKGDDGETVSMCTLYPGMTCRQHVDIAVEVDNSREDDLPRVEFVELCPNSWLIAPTGGLAEASASSDEDTKPYVQIAEKDQFTSQGIEKAAAAFQKRLGEPLPAKHVAGVREILADAARHQEEEAWKPALLALSELNDLAKHLPRSLRAMVKARLEEIDEEVRYLFEEIVDEPDLIKAQGLLTMTEPEVLGERLPVRADIAAWLKDQKK